MPPFYKILNFVLQLLALFGSVAIILVKEAVPGLVSVKTLFHAMGPSKIGFVCNHIQNLLSVSY